MEMTKQWPKIPQTQSKKQIYKIKGLSKPQEDKYSWPLNHTGVNPSITYSPSSKCVVPMHPQIQPTTDHVALKYFLLKTDLYISGPAQFKSKFFKSQGYTENHT